MNYNTSASDSEKSIRDQLEHYLKRWYWFVLAVLLSLTAGFIYLRYSTKLYKTEAAVIIKDEKNGGAAELAAFSDLGGLMTKFGNNKIQNELAIFKSKRIIGAVIRNLNLNVTYESIGTIKTSELYEYKPFVVQYLSLKEKRGSIIVPKLFFQINSETEFLMSVGNDENPSTYNFGTPIALPFGDITVIPSLESLDAFNSFKGKEISVRYGNIENLALYYQRSVEVVNEINNSNVVAIRLQSPVTSKAEDFINDLIFQYNQDAIKDRGQIAKKTSDFIDSRLEIITRELDSVERDKESFKSNNRLTNIEAEAQLILENASEFEKRQFDVNTQLELANSMIEYMERSSPNDLLPSNIGIEGDNITEAVNNYNALILERNKLLRNSTAKNPVVINVSNQINNIRNNILSGLKNTTNSLKISLRDLNYQESTLNSKLSAVPTKEKIFRGIERQQTIKEQLYLFLLQQREEASISLAVTAPKAKIVDRAFSSRAPVSPDRLLILLGSAIMGLLIPFLIIYIGTILNNKVTSRHDLEVILNDISIIGEIPKLKKGDEHLIEVNDRSILAESFRILRTNLQYLFINKLAKNDTAHSVFVTSTIKGEGKTFVAFNLALTIALTGKKVVLVGADIRNPQLQRYLPAEEKNSKGLTEYIVDEQLSIEEISNKSLYNKYLDIVLSGVIPPNPAELLMEPRTEQFFSEIRQKYDYVIVDTAPSMLVTDTIIINKLADITLYVTRAGYTEKKLLEFPKDAIADGRLINVASVLNNVSMSNFGYGNKYGYSYTSEKVSWKSRLFKRS